jgi:hypothetical protein
MSQTITEVETLVKTPSKVDVQKLNALSPTRVITPLFTSNSQPKWSVQKRDSPDKITMKPFSERVIKPIPISTYQTPRYLKDEEDEEKFNIQMLYRNEEENIPKRNRPNYKIMSQEEKDKAKMMFISKFDTIKMNYPNWKIMDIPPDYSLDQIHDLYENYIKQISISMNSNQWKVYIVIMFLVIEIFGIKVLGLDFRGYTKSQMRNIKQFDRLLIELGEKYYTQKSFNWPIEVKLIITAGFNAFIFIIAKYLSKYVGNDSIADTIQDMLNGYVEDNLFKETGNKTDENGLPKIPKEGKEGVDNILGSILGNSDLSKLIGTIGSSFTKSMKTNKLPTFDD